MTGTWRRILTPILVLAGLSLCLVHPASIRAEATVYLHGSAYPEEEHYTLGQVASVHSSDPATAALLRQIPLGRTPLRPTLLPVMAIRDRVSPAVSDVIIIGERVALLPPAVVGASQRWFFEALLRFLDSQDGYKQGRIEVELLSEPLILENSGDAPAEHRGMAGGWQERVVFDAERSPYSSGFQSTLSGEVIPAGTMRLTYNVLAPSGAGARFTAKMEGSFRIWVHNFLPVARARVDLPANAELTDDVLAYTVEDVSLLNTPFLLRGESIQSYKTVSSLSRGQLIQRLQRLQAVRAGDTVRITFARPGLEISLPGRAFRSGSVGETIDVRPSNTNTRLQARITAKGEVLIESD